MNKNAFLLLISLTVCSAYSLKPNLIISRYKPVYGSPSNNVEILVNGKFGETWNVNNGSWVAIRTGGNYSKILLNWNNTGGSWSDSIAAATSCKSGLSIPIDYDILKSINSTNGMDGDWVLVLSVRNNTVTARSHTIDYIGAQWVKMTIVKGSGSLDEVEVFDVTNGNDDTWFFPGTSISAVSFKSTVPAKNFADLITESHPEFTPAIIRGGIGCINSTTFANDISKYLSVVRNTKYWAIEMGTNDAWGGSNYNVQTYIKNMQLIIDSCKANNIQPIIARIIGTDSAKVGWQVHPDYLKAIDSLTKSNQLMSGPDLYTYFSTHPSELYDGVHPNATGGANVFRMWAQKMDSLYVSSVSVKKDSKSSNVKNRPGLVRSRCGKKYTVVNVVHGGTLSIYAIDGTVLNKIILPEKGSCKIESGKGIFLVQFVSSNGKISFTIPNLN